MVNGNRPALIERFVGPGTKWPEVNRKSPPSLSPLGRAFRRERYTAEYERLSKVWEAKGDIDMALFWMEQARRLG